MMDKTVSDKQIKELKEKAYAEWSDNRLVRLTISTIPEGERQEGLKELLRSAFDAGFAGGQAAIALVMLEGMFKRFEGK